MVTMRRRVQKLILPLVAVAVTACGGKSVRSNPAPPSDRSVVIAVTVRGIEGATGTIRIALFASEAGFPDRPDLALRRGAWPASADTLATFFEGVPAGRYAVSVLHDADDDGEMATDFMGRPKEGYGFSRDARGRFGPPGFESAAFEADTDTCRVVIHLEY
jgi:uncharacterized protein (DUF2141 family)